MFRCPPHTHTHTRVRVYTPPPQHEDWMKDCWPQWPLLYRATSVLEHITILTNQFLNRKLPRLLNKISVPENCQTKLTRMELFQSRLYTFVCCTVPFSLPLFISPLIWFLNNSVLEQNFRRNYGAEPRLLFTCALSLILSTFTQI